MGIEPIGTCFANKLLTISGPFVKITVVFFDSIHKKARLAERAGLRANAAERATCGRAGPVVFRRNQPTRANTNEWMPSAEAEFGVEFAGSSGGERTLRFRLLAVPSARTGNRKLKTVNRVLGHKKSPASRAKPGLVFRQDEIQGRVHSPTAQARRWLQSRQGFRIPNRWVC